MSRDLDAARKAYMSGNIEMSKKAHDPIEINLDQQIVPLKPQDAEKHQTGGDYIKSAVFGGLDGMLTVYAIVVGSYGANFSSLVVLALGVASLISDGFAMAIGDYLSTKAEIEFTASERKREEWEVEHNIDGEKLEMIDIYMAKGISQEDAVKVVNSISKNKDAFVDIMMAEELGIITSDENPLMNALVTFLAFVLFGVVPIIPYIVSAISGLNQQLFLVSTVLTGLFLFILGVSKSMFSYGKWYISGGETLCVGVLASVVSFLLGWGFSKINV